MCSVLKVYNGKEFLFVLYFSLIDCFFNENVDGSFRFFFLLYPLHKHVCPYSFTTLKKT